MTLLLVALLALDPRAFVEKVVGEVVAVARSESYDPAAKRALVERAIEEHLDLAAMTRAALGSRAADFSPDERVAFAQEFQRHLVNVYARRVATLDVDAVEVQDARLEGELATVRTLGGTRGSAYRYPRQGSPTRASVDYRLGSVRGEWRIVGISINGVDVTRSFREQFESFLERSTPDALISELRVRNERNAAENPFATK